MSSPIRSLTVTLAFCLVFNGGCGSSTPQTVLSDFLDAAMENDHPEILRTLSRDSRRIVKLREQPVGRFEFRVDTVFRDEEMAIVRTTIQKEDHSMQIPFALIMEDGEWKVDLRKTAHRTLVEKGFRAIEMLAATFDGILDSIPRLGTAIEEFSKGLGHAIQSLGDGLDKGIKSLGSGLDKGIKSLGGGLDKGIETAGRLVR